MELILRHRQDIQAYLDAAGLPWSAQEEEHAETSPCEDRKQHLVVSYAHLVQLRAFLQKHHPHVYLHELLKGAKTHLPRPKAPQKSKELLRILAQAERTVREREYWSMMNKPVPVSAEEDQVQSPAQLWKEVNSHITTVFNILFTVVSVFVAVYYYGHYVVHELGLKILLALACAFGVGACEVYLYLVRTNAALKVPRGGRLGGIKGTAMQQQHEKEE